MDLNTIYRPLLFKPESTANTIAPSPDTDSLFAGHSPFVQDSIKGLNLIVSTELQRFRCLETGKVGSLTELAVTLEQRAETQKEERNAS